MTLTDKVGRQLKQGLSTPTLFKSMAIVQAVLDTYVDKISRKLMTTATFYLQDRKNFFSAVILDLDGIQGLKSSPSRLEIPWEVSALGVE